MNREVFVIFSNVNMQPIKTHSQDETKQPSKFPTSLQILQTKVTKALHWPRTIKSWQIGKNSLLQDVLFKLFLKDQYEIAVSVACLMEVSELS